MLPKYQEVSDKQLAIMSAEDKIEEIKKAHQWMSENYIKDNDEHNYYVYIYFADIVQRLI
jgi:hypothetical protein